MSDSTEKLVNNKNVGIAMKILRAAAHPLRLQIILFIDKHKKINVNKIYHSLDLEQSLTSQHLRILREANIVLTERDGKFIYYTLNYPALRLISEVVDRFFAS